MEKAVAAAKGRVALANVNIDDAAKLARAQAIEYVPTIRLHFRKKPISEWEGAATPRVLAAWIDDYLRNVAKLGS